MEHSISITANAPMQINDKISSFIFNVEKNIWLLKLTKERIIFNHDKFPNNSPGDFADDFCKILEKCFDVSFIKK